jgi:hypothetical protein
MTTTTSQPSITFSGTNIAHTPTANSTQLYQIYCQTQHEMHVCVQKHIELHMCHPSALYNDNPYIHQVQKCMNKTMRSFESFVLTISDQPNPLHITFTDYIHCCDYDPLNQLLPQPYQPWVQQIQFACTYNESQMQHAISNLSRRVNKWKEALKQLENACPFKC